MEDTFYKSVIKNAAFGYACHEIIFDKNGNRSDYRIIDVNPAYEEITGLSSSVLGGSLISERLVQMSKSGSLTGMFR